MNTNDDPVWLLEWACGVNAEGNEVWVLSELGSDEHVQPSTMRAQIARWRKHHGDLADAVYRLRNIKTGRFLLLGSGPPDDAP